MSAGTAGAAALGGVDLEGAREPAGLPSRTNGLGRPLPAVRMMLVAAQRRAEAPSSEAGGRRAWIGRGAAGDEAGWQVEPLLEGDEIDSAMHDQQERGRSGGRARA